jgi:ParB family transcriptional regulator, chromosome partitioning protein
MSKIILDTETFTVPLDRLVRDPANVRVADRDADIAALAHNIAHEGLLQNLGVRPVLDSGQPTDRYSVAIGGRRHAALKYLVKAKRLPKDAPIRCSLVKNEAVTSAGASENLQRIAMHPADAYAAFAKMSDDGLSDAEIAVRFSITPQTVQKRLRLGRLSPKLLDALRANGMTEQVAQAFAITTDTEAQERVFDRLQGRGSIDPRMVRSILTEGEVPALDRRVRFVGLAAYEAAGGAVRRDLFSDGLEGVTLLDPAKLDDLVLAKLAIAAADLRTAGWRNVQVTIEDPEEQRHFRPAPYTRISLSDEDAAKLAALTEEYETFEDIYEDELTEDQVARHDAIEAEMDAIQAREDQYDDTTKAAAAVFVYLDYHGPRTYFGVRSDFGDGDHVRGDGDVNANGDTEEDGNEEAEESEQRPIPAADDKPALSGALTAELLAHRTAGLRAQVMERPGLALRLVVQSLLPDGSYQRSVAKISGHGPYLKAACPSIDETKAGRMLADEMDRLGQHQPGRPVDVLPWLLSLTDSEAIGVLTPLVASTIDAGTEDWSQRGQLSLAAQTARAAEVNMSDYWTPDAESYFGRITKAQIAQAVREAEGTTRPFDADGKKADIAAAATRRVAGTGWLPGILRVPPVDSAE